MAQLLHDSCTWTSLEVPKDFTSSGACHLPLLLYARHLSRTTRCLTLPELLKDFRQVSAQRQVMTPPMASARGSDPHSCMYAGASLHPALVLRGQGRDPTALNRPTQPLGPTNMGSRLPAGRCQRVTCAHGPRTRKVPGRCLSIHTGRLSQPHLAPWSSWPGLPLCEKPLCDEPGMQTQALQQASAGS